MGFFTRIMTPDDVEEILDFENKKLVEVEPNENEREFIKWSSRWRKESLNHYSSLGWSFIARDNELKSSLSTEGQLVGYFLAQPLLFLDGQTQSLWVEHVSFSTLQSRDQMVELAYKLSREKHFQRVYFQNIPGLSNSVGMFRPEPWNSSMTFLKTTKV